MSNKKTTKQIDSLTPEQEAKIPEYLERFKAIGMSTAPTDRLKAEAAVRAHYEYCAKNGGSNVPAPQFIWAESPMEGIKLAAQYAKGDENVTDAEVRDQASRASYGSFEAYWVATYAFVAEQLPVEKDELTDIAINIVKECGVYWSFEDIVVMTPKPTKIVMVDGKLHNTEGPALEYPNGDCGYWVNGELKRSLMEAALATRLGAVIQGPQSESA